MIIPPLHSPKHQWRFRVILGILAICVFALLWRMIDLNIINHRFLLTQGNERTLRDVSIPSFRGMITDRNGEPLAISTPVYALWANPKTLDLSQAEMIQLGKLIQTDPNEITALLQKDANREFVYIKRDIDPDLADQIKSLNLKGLYLERQYRRFYPEGEATAHVLGITNIDDHGQEGLELACDQWLQGTPGEKRVIIDRYGNEVGDVSMLQQPVPGHNLTLSIDNRIQYMAYRELLNGVQQFGASSGSVVVLDIHTGEILAMTNVPSYNPNIRPTAEDASYRNRAVTDTFEPGSTIKPYAMAVAISTGKFSPNSQVNTSPGYLFIDGKKVDDDGVNNGIIDLTRILQVSSNVGMSKVILTVPPQLFWNTLLQLGFGQNTGSGFPGESIGTLDKNALHSPFVLATLSFGYGISVNLLQLAHAYATLANNGVKIPLTFLKSDAPPQGVQVLDPKVSGEILTMLQSVLETGGTATAARVPGYTVTGKTGTARILGPNGYEKDHHNSIFVGIAPASHPQLVVAVFLHDPSKLNYFGGYVAGPVFSRIMGEALRLLNIPPDNLSSTLQPLSTTP